MSDTNSILKSIEFVNGKLKESNQNELDIFFHLSAIKISEAWKKPDFYTGAQHLSFYANKKFPAIMKEVFNRTSVWFRNMDAILMMDNGKELLLKYGRKNIIAYRGFSPEEQKAVLDLAKVRPTSCFHALLKSAGLKGQKDKAIDKIQEGVWKQKYLSLEREHQKLQRKYDALVIKCKNQSNIIKMYKRNHERANRIYSETPQNLSI
jgi:hypothetical protein